MSNGENRKSWITEGTIIVGLFTFLGYICAFNYESGYLGFFKIPSHFINIGLPHITMVGSIIIPSVIFLLWLIKYGSTPIQLRSHELFKSLIIFVLVLVIIFLDFSLYGLDKKIVYGLQMKNSIVISLTFISVSIILLFLFQYIIIKAKHGDFPNPNYFLRHTNIESILFFLLCMAFFILFLAWIGKESALHQEEFLILSDHPDIVVLRIYGDNLICAEFDRQSRIVKTTFAVFKLAYESKQGLDAKQNLILAPLLRLEKIGPLKVEKIPKK